MYPDYLGLGVSNMLHPYHYAEATASAVIYMVRAGKLFSNSSNELQHNSQLFLTGYSEEGYASMAAH